MGYLTDQEIVDIVAEVSSIEQAIRFLDYYNLFCHELFWCSCEVIAKYNEVKDRL